jgi:hypothetical protein
MKTAVVPVGTLISWLAWSGIGTVTVSHSSFTSIVSDGTIIQAIGGGGEGIITGWERELYFGPSTVRTDLWWRPSMRWWFRVHLKTLIDKPVQ